MLLDRQRVPRELLDFGVGDRKALALGGRHVDGRYRFAGAGLVGEDHLDRLFADALAQDRRPPGREVRLVDVELVGIHGALHDGFAQAVRGGDEHHLVEAGLGVEREHDAGRALVAAHHALDADRQRDVGIGVALVRAIRNGPIGVEGGKYFSYRMKKIV